MRKLTVYDTITAQIIKSATSNPGTPKMPWTSSGSLPFVMPRNATSNRTYNGINIIVLWMTAADRNYRSAQWATYKQWQSMGAQVRRGERVTPVIFYREYDVRPTDDGDDGKRRVARTSGVFNAAQIDGYTGPELPFVDHGPVVTTQNYNRLVANTKAIIHHGGNRAFYSVANDTITLPDQGRFTGTDTMDRHHGYMATALHELAHWTGADSRLARDFRKRFDTHARAAEEVVAEIASAFLCSDLAIAATPPPDHAQYIAHYIKLLDADSRAIFTLAAAAAKAADYIRQCPPPWEDDPPKTQDIPAAGPSPAAFSYPPPRSRIST